MKIVAIHTKNLQITLNMVPIVVTTITTTIPIVATTITFNPNPLQKKNTIFPLETWLHYITKTQ